MSFVTQLHCGEEKLLFLSFSANLDQATIENVVAMETCKVLFSKSVLDIKKRLVVVVKLGTKWMPNSDSASHFMPEYKFLG